jgi:rhodanese-related sulfurtransferase
MNKNNLRKFSSTLLLSFLLFFNGCGTTDPTGNKLPIADAGEDITVIQNELFTFDARNSYDLDGTITNYEWFCPGFNISLYSGPNSTLTMPAGRPVGDYNTTLIVTDDKNATAKDYVIVKIIAPRFLAHAGMDFNVTENGFFTLDANESFYLDGTITSYEWLYTDNNDTLYKGSEEKTPNIQANRSVGNYNIKLIVTNDKNETAEDSVIIRIGDAPFTDVFDRGISVEQFKILQQENTVYIDIRTDGELSSGIIEGSETILNPNGIGMWLQEGSDFLNLGISKDDSFTIICATDSRASGVANGLYDNGYIHVHYIVGGINAWKNAGNPVVDVN